MTAEAGAVSLTDDELSVLVGLTRVLAGIDHHFDREEAGAVASIAREFGEEAFWAKMQQTFDDDLTTESIVELAKTVDRQDAREVIYGNLYELATHGGIATSEAELLATLESTWNLKVSDIAPE